MQNALLNMRCLVEACRRAGISFRTHDDFGNVVSIRRRDKEYFFVNFTMPFNNDSVSRICKDKEFAYRLLKDVIRMPATLGFFDPAYEDERFAQFKKERSVAEITRKILSAFSLPMIVKMNAGTRGTNVYKCESADDVEHSLAAIFNKSSRHYDYIALAQEYIPPAHEFRVIVFRKKVLLAYEKDISHARYVGNLSPLHWEGAHAVHTTDAFALARFEHFLLPVFGIVPVEFCGADIIEDAQGRFHLLELNTMPGFYLFAKDNGEEPIVQMYGEILHML